MSQTETKSSGGNPRHLEIRGSLLAKNTVLNFVGLALPMAVGLATIPFVVRWLGTDRFGVLSLAWVVVGYFSFFDLGLGRATTKYVAEALGKGEIEKIPGYFWTTAYIQAVLGTLGAVILWLITPLLVTRVLNIPPALIGETKKTFIFLAISLPIVMISASVRGLLEAAQRFDLVNIVKIPSSIVNYVLPLVGILMGFGLPGIMILLVASRALTLLAWAWLAFKLFPTLGSRPKPERKAFRPLLSFGGWVTVSSVIGPILVYLDRFFIGSLITITAVGLYSAPYEFVMRLGIIPGSLMMTLFPTFSAWGRDENKEKTETLFARSVKYTLIIMGFIVILLILTGHVFIGVLLGDEFLQKSLLVFQILLVGFLLNTLANVPFGYLQGIGRADITAKYHLLELAFYVPLTWILVKRWGINGAALSWTIRNAADTGLLFWASSRKGGMKFSRLLKNQMIGVVCLLGILALAGGFVMRTSWWVSGLCVLAAGFLPAAWFSVISGAERDWIKGLIGRFLERKRINA